MCVLYVQCVVVPLARVSLHYGSDMWIYKVGEREDECIWCNWKN